MLEEHASESAFLTAHLAAGRAGLAVDPSAETRPWTPKRVAQGTERACPGCRATSPVTAWIRDRCPKCGGRFR